MKIIAMIPARYAATRFPFKLMKPLGNKTVIRHTYDNTVATGLFREVYVVTDHEFIFNEIVKIGGKAIMSVNKHESGSDRIAEAVENIDADVVLNVQGDEPFVQKEPLKPHLRVSASRSSIPAQGSGATRQSASPCPSANRGVARLSPRLPARSARGRKQASS